MPLNNRLFSSAIPADFNSTVDRIAGPWCCADAEDMYPAWESIPVPRPFADSDAVAAADRVVARQAWTLLPQLAAELNARHGVSYGLDYWHVLLMRWLLETLYVIHTCRATARKIVEEHDGKPLTVHSVPDAQAWGFKTIRDHLHAGVFHPYFIGWIMSKALRDVAPDTFEFRDCTEEAHVAALNFDIGHGCSRVRAELRKAFQRFKSGRFDIGISASEDSACQKLASAAYHLYFHTLLSVCPTQTRRADAAQMKDRYALPEGTDLSFEKAIVDAVLPASFAASFHRYDDEAQRHKFRPGRLSVRVPAFQLDEPSIFKHAHAVENGERLAFVQHGANYGVAKAYSLGSETEYVQDAFITWGWDEHGDAAGTFIPSPTPVLSSWRNRYKGDDDSLLLVGAATHLTNNRLINTGEIFNRMTQRAERCRFFDTLPLDVTNHLLYRPYPTMNYGAEDSPYFARKYPKMRQCLTDFRQTLLNCRLLVIDHPGATMYLGMVANVPMILYWDAETWATCPQAEPFFEKMKTLGILHSDGAGAAQRVATVWEDVAGWWQSAAIQGFRRSFCANYARTSASWMWDWTKMLWSL